MWEVIWKVIILVLAVVSVASLVIIVGSLRQAIRRLDELTKTFHQFRGSLNEVIGSQQGSIEAARERNEQEAARTILQKDHP